MNPVFQRDGVSIFQGDALAVLRTLPADSVHCCVTSPPYWGLRQYLFEGAVVLSSDLDPETRTSVLDELKKLGITPKL